MQFKLIFKNFPVLFFFIAMTVSQTGFSQSSEELTEVDKKVKAFLSEKGYSWRDMNVPATDGQLLYDLIVKNGYKNAVEIGTSTGHSGVWIAWALSKTGGKLITLEIDERRYKEALANFERAGVAGYIDARLGNAHEIVPQLTGPIDFVFSDADKDWYKNYFIALAPKLKTGGCFVAHNIRQGRRQSGIAEYVNHIESLTNFKTSYNDDGGGVSISYKLSEE